MVVVMLVDDHDDFLAWQLTKAFGDHITLIGPPWVVAMMDVQRLFEQSLESLADGPDAVLGLCACCCFGQGTLPFL